MKKTFTLSSGDYLETLALKATFTTLKTAHMKTSSIDIERLQTSLKVDLAMLNAGNINYVLSPAYDLYHTAYCYLYESIVIDGYNENSVIGFKKDKNKNDDLEKPITVFVQACREVRNYINKQKNQFSNITNTYIQDLKTNESGEIIEGDFLKVTKYYDITNLQEFTEFSELYEDIKARLKNDRTLSILHMRLKGMSVNDIAKKLQVSHQAISKHLIKIQDIVKEIKPTKVKRFIEKRKYN